MKNNYPTSGKKTWFSLLAAFTMLLFCSVAMAQQTFIFSSNQAVTIPDNGYNGTLGSMAGSGVTASVPAGTVTNIEVDLSMTHTWIGDLVIKLQSPSGTVLGIMSRPGLAESADDGTGCCGFSSNLDGAVITFSDAGVTDAESMGAGLLSTQFVCTNDGFCSYFPNPGSVATPPSTFTELFTEAMNGTWTLYVGDAAGGDIGSILSWSLKISMVFDCSAGIGCQNPDQSNAYTSSTNSTFKVFDGFVPQTSGPITSVCWYGGYYDFNLPGECSPSPADDFSITYYNDNGGAVGSVLAGPFSVSPTKLPTGGPLIAGLITEYGYEATHPPVNVIAYQGYWISIENNLTGTCYWLWETASPGDNILFHNISGFIAADLAFCLDVPINNDGLLSAAPVNDVCSQAIAINCGDVVMGTTTNATTQDAPGICETGLNTAGGVWYSFVGTGENTIVTTCGAGTTYDTKLGVFTGSCGALTCVAGNDDQGASCTFSNFQSRVVFCTSAGTTYYVYVTGFGSETGDFELSITCGGGPANDLCVNAVPVTTNSTTPYSNVNACTDGPSEPTNCNFFSAPNIFSDIWYSWTADVSCDVTISLCGSSYDTDLAVYDGTAGCPTVESAIACNDDFCALQSQVTFTPVLGTTYLIRVGSFSSTAQGSGTLAVIVNDVTPPVIVNCPADVTVNASAGTCQASVTIPVPVFGVDFTDNCSATIVNDYTGTANASSIYPVGATTVTWTVTDFGGNTVTCTQTVTVNDVEAPVVYCGPMELYNNGPLVNSPGTGFGGADESILQSVSLGMNVIGFGHDVDAGVRLADDFTITNPNGWTINEIVFYAYQTGSSTTSTINHYNLQIWDGVPGGGGSVVWGDGTTNLLVHTEWSGIYRVTETSSGSIARPVMRNTISLGGVNLPPGTYWLDWQANGTLASGPWAPPVTINGQTTTGNALQSLDGGVTYAAAEDNGTFTGQDLPFIIHGSQTLENDPGVCEAWVDVLPPLAVEACSLPVSYINDFNNTSDASDFYPVGTTTVTWTVTDAAGNSTDCSFDVTVEDTENPTIDCNIGGGGIICSTIASTDVPKAISASGTPIITSTLTFSGSGFISDINVLNLTGTHTWVSDLTFQLTSPQGTTVTLIDQICGSMDDFNINLDDEAGSGLTCPLNLGNTQIPLNALSNFDGEDPNGVWTLTIIDNFNLDGGSLNSWSLEICTSTPPNYLIVDNDPGECEADVTVPSPLFNDNCPGAVLTNNITGTDNASGTYGVGTTPVVWTVTDAAGNTETCTYYVVVQDVEAPVITCPSDITQNVDAGVCGATVTFEATAIDNCSATVSYSHASGSMFPIGTTTVTATATDPAGNSVSCTFDVTIIDNEGPQVDCSQFLLYNNDPTGSFITHPGAGFGGADASAVLGSTFGYGHQVAANNRVADDFTITNPNGWTIDEIVFYAYQTGSTTTSTINHVNLRIWNGVPDGGGSVIWGDGVTNLLVSSEFSGIYRVTSTTLTNTTRPVMKNTISLGGVYLPPGTYWLDWQTDGTLGSGPWAPPHSITGNARQSISGGAFTALTDGTGTPDFPFEIRGTTDLVFDNDPGLCTATLDIPVPLYDDCSGILSVVNDFNGTANASGTYNAGTTTVVWTITDNEGNVSTCSFDVVVNDVEIPTIDCGSDPIVCNTTASTDVPVAIDAGVNPVTSTITIASSGIISDVNLLGLMITHAWIGDVDITLTSPAGTTINILQDLCDFGDMDLNLNFDDAGAPYGSIPCPPTDGGTYQPINPFSAFNGENMQGVWTLTIFDDFFGLDGGTLDAWSLEICTGTGGTTVYAVSNDPGECGAQVTIAPPTYSDNCPVTLENSYNGTDDASDFYPVGTHIVTWTVTDPSGNSATCDITVVVTDDEDPVITCPADIFVNNDLGQCGAVVTFDAPEISDNCPIPAMVLFSYSGAQVPIPDNNPGGTTATIDVSGLIGNVLGTDVDLESVCIDITHTWVGDLNVSLMSPDGTTIPLVSRPGSPATFFGCSGDDIDACFVAGTGNDVENVCAGTTPTISGTYTVSAGFDLADFGTGGAANGTWTLIVSDNAGGDVGTINGFSLTFLDYNATPQAIQIAGLPSGSEFPVGTTTNTFQVTDASGNTATCSFDVVISDTELPVFADCPTDITVDNDPGVCGALVSYTVPVGGGMYQQLGNAFENGRASNSAFPLIAADDFTLTNNGGCFDFTHVTANFFTNTPGSLSSVLINIYSDAGGMPGAIISSQTILPANWTSSVVGSNFGYSVHAFDFTLNSPVNLCGSPGGSTYWVAVQGNGVAANQFYWEFSTTQPYGNNGMLDDGTGWFSLGDNFVFSIRTETPNVSDNCPGFISVTQTDGTGYTSGDVFPVGTTLQEFTAEDQYGNIAVCSFNVVVEDVEDPTIVCPADIVACENDAVVNYPDPVANDNCPGFTVVQTDGLPSGSTFPIGVTTNTFEVTDASGNTATCSFDVTITPVPVVDFTFAPTCVGEIIFFTSTASVNPILGTSIVSYEWEFSDGSGINTDVNPVHVYNTAGDYDVTLTVTTNWGCQASITYTVTVSDPPVYTVSVTDALCNGDANGSITIDVTGGNSPVTFSLNGGPEQSSNVFSGLSAGTYTITLNNGCIRTTTVTVGQPDALVLSAASQPVLCFGDTSGSIEVTATGGTVPYQYSIDGGTTFQQSGSFQGLTSGNYVVVVQDDNGCSVSQGVNITEPAQALAATADVQNVACTGDDSGVITVMATGGTGAYTYSLDGGTTTQSGAVFSGLAAGDYTVTVQDANGCSITVDVSVSQPAELLTLNAQAVPVSCNGQGDGQINATATGGDAPYQYSFNGGLTWQQSGSFTGLAPGTYTIMAQDANGCQVATVVQVTQPAVLTLAQTGSQNSTCEGQANGSFTVEASGGTGPYTYTSGGNSSSSGAFPNVTSGVHLVTVTDASGCSASVSVTVGFNNPLPDAAFSWFAAGSTVQFSNQSTNGTSYSWDFGDGTTSTEQNPVHTYAAGGSYTVTLIVTNNCGSDTVTYVIDTNSIGINDPNGAAFTLNIFPNPNQGDFTLTYTGTGIIGQIQVNILTIEGKTVIVEQFTVNEDTFVRNYKDVELAAGTYLVHFITERGYEVKRIIVNR